MTGYAAALALTLAVELPLYATVLGAGLSVPWRRAVALGLGVNLLTHPFVWFVAFPLLTPLLGRLAAAGVVEVGVWVTEAAAIAAVVRRDRAAVVALALLANAASFTVGLLVLG